jgi:hypothetical protein
MLQAFVKGELHKIKMLKALTDIRLDWRYLNKPRATWYRKSSPLKKYWSQSREQTCGGNTEVKSVSNQS